MELSKQQQLEFLFSIVTEASKWEKSPGDDRDSIRMEVEERIASLLRGGEVIKDGRIQSVLYPDPSPSEPEQLTPKKKSNKKYSDKFAETHRRVSVNGVTKWYSLDQLEQVPTPNSRTGYKWRLRDQATEASDDGRTEEA